MDFKRTLEDELDRKGSRKTRNLFDEDWAAYNAATKLANDIRDLAEDYDIIDLKRFTIAFCEELQLAIGVTGDDIDAYERRHEHLDGLIHPIMPQRIPT